MNFNKNEIYNFIGQLDEDFPSSEKEAIITIHNRDYKIIARKINNCAEVVIFDDQSETAEMIKLDFNCSPENQYELFCYKEFRKNGTTQKVIEFQVDKTSGYISLRTVEPSISFDNKNKLICQLGNHKELDLSKLIECEEINNDILSSFRAFEFSNNPQDDETRFGEITDNLLKILDSNAYPLIIEATETQI